jgi:hypothetical protein
LTLRKTMTIRQRVYDVKQITRLKYKGKVVNGLYDFDARTIEIRKEQSDGNKLQTVIHELLHAVGWEYGIWELQTDKSNFVDKLACAIACEFTRNKIYRLFEQLTKK